MNASALMHKLSRLNIHDMHSLQVAEFVDAFNNGLLPEIFFNYLCLNSSKFTNITRKLRTTVHGLLE